MLSRLVGGTKYMLVEIVKLIWVNKRPANTIIKGCRSRPDLLDAQVAGFSKCGTHNTLHGPLKGV
jgi:hypothetical protein